MKKVQTRILSSKQEEDVIKLLNERFNQNMNRHVRYKWPQIEDRLRGNSEKLWSLNDMEKTGGEPDVVDLDSKTGEVIFIDCSKESPKGRRSLCYDNEALESRKKFKPKGSVIDMVTNMGTELLSEEQYRKFQEFGGFDLKTSSWLKTPEKVRELGGAIFGDRRFDTVFIFHNGADSYYSSRGFRCLLKL